MSSKQDLSGFDELSDVLKQFEKLDEDTILDALKKSADGLVKDVKKLPKPRSDIGGSHTHMLDSVGSSKGKNAVNTGWMKYYGRMVETGHKTVNGKNVKPQEHLVKTWDKKKDQYIDMALKELKVKGN